MDYTVGQLAKRTGLTVRTLHHYEQLGLLRPSGRTEAGYRRYAEADVLRLHRLLALRDAGLALKDIGPLLDGEAPQPLAAVLHQQIQQLQARLLEQERLLATLKHAQHRLERHGDEADAVSVLLDAMAAGRIRQRHFSPDQFQRMNRHWEGLTPEQRQTCEQEWPTLIEAARQAFERRDDPASPSMQALVKRWIELQDMFFNISPDVYESFKRMYDSEPEMQRQMGLSAELITYLRQAATIYRAQAT